MILVKSIMESILVFWLTLGNIPKNILVLIKKSATQFLWSGKNNKGGLSLVKWQSLAFPKKLEIGA